MYLFTQGLKDKRYRPPTELYRYQSQESLWEHFNILCRGEVLREPKDDMNLTCKYLHYSDPYLRLGPFKLEEKNLQPFISVLHDFMYESETNYYREQVIILRLFAYQTGLKMHRNLRPRVQCQTVVFFSCLGPR